MCDSNWAPFGVNIVAPNFEVNRIAPMLKRIQVSVRMLIRMEKRAVLSVLIRPICIIPPSKANKTQTACHLRVHYQSMVVLTPGNANSI